MKSSLCMSRILRFVFCWLSELALLMDEPMLSGVCRVCRRELRVQAALRLRVLEGGDSTHTRARVLRPRGVLLAAHASRETGAHLYNLKAK